MEYALAIQELFPALSRLYQKPAELIFNCEQKNNFTISRIYLGGSFCGKLFNSTTAQQFEYFQHYCQSENIKISLTIPIFTERQLSLGKQICHNLLERYSELIDEVTINDYAMYEFIDNIFSGRILSGRLLNKVNRDPRYSKYGQEGISIPKLHLQISGAELDGCSSKIILENPIEDFVAAIYYPYSFISTGMICSYAAIGKDIMSKFLLDGYCPVSCGKYYTKHDDRDGNYFYHIGNSIYYLSDFPKVIGASTVRMIWFPLDMWEDKSEHSCTSEQS